MTVLLAARHASGGPLVTKLEAKVRAKRIDERSFGFDRDQREHLQDLGCFG